ncbi:hypothetical protein, partial [Massilia genomosp. 1]|uniref:hypothetical protein n=1 Tax=Massilia genomosp. 1 TaxID=2609280 RepID=UPI001C9E3B44
MKFDNSMVQYEGRFNRIAAPPVSDYLSGVFLNKVCRDLERCSGVFRVRSCAVLLTSFPGA